MTIVEFLEARIAEDEAAARGADGARWFHSDKVVTFEVLRGDGWDEVSPPISVDTRANGWHITRWSPARVLAECEAKRRIVERHARRRTILTGAPWVEFGWNSSGLRLEMPDGSVLDGAAADALYDKWTEPSIGDELRDLAAVYADHPDYDPAWRIQ